MKRWIIAVGLLCIVGLGFALRRHLDAAVGIATARLTTKKSMADRLTQYGDAARSRLTPAFMKRGVGYPPRSLVLAGIKDERRLEVHASDAAGPKRFICAYPILAASGSLGPKLQEGDGQVPEGIYPIESLNPNSRFHLSLRLGYPNDFERGQAAREGRTRLGSDIMIHGKAVSAGCLAVGDRAVEELFVLAADTGLTNITVILAPVDFRLGRTIPTSARLPGWVDSLYDTIRANLVSLEPSR
jgi:murein L,D-transpeptidase YafK